MAKDRSGGKG